MMKNQFMKSLKVGDILYQKNPTINYYFLDDFFPSRNYNGTYNKPTKKLTGLTGFKKVLNDMFDENNKIIISKITRKYIYAKNINLTGFAYIIVEDDNDIKTSYYRRNRVLRLKNLIKDKSVPIGVLREKIIKELNYRIDLKLKEEVDINEALKIMSKTKTEAEVILSSLV